ncbi:MAG: PASTA domain-containing protein, partial [Bacilli bacterium]|nr:PASTA domain-containing protein [Bacilli bacterium]
LVVIITTLVFLIPQFTKVKEVKIPENIINMSVVDAEKELEKLGLTVASETKEISSSDIVSGNVVKTNPSIGRTVKKGTEITLYVSTGENGYIVEELKGKNVDEVRAILEKMYNLLVIVRTEDVGANGTANTIIRSEPEAGTRLTEGQQIILYVPDMTATYPDFTKGKYTLKEIEAWCEKYGVELLPIYQETDEYKAGTIYDQSQKPGTTVVKNASLTIYIADEYVGDDRPAEDYDRDTGE